MASQEVRTAVKAAVEAAASPLDVFDLSDYVTLEDCLGNIDSEAVLIQYTASGETPVTVGGAGNAGYEETDSVALHLMVPTGFASSPAVGTGDSIREQLRGQRLTAEIHVETIDPFVDMPSGLYGGAWHAWVSNMFIVRRDCG
jgi:hypothetical protein